MPLQDHFRPPLGIWRHWHSFHNGWATSLAADLNIRLPEGWFAEANVQYGVEIDVATLEEKELSGLYPAPEIQLQPEYTPPSPGQTVPFTPVTEIAEVNIYNSTAGPLLSAAIEMVSPSNKDRPESRDDFVSKCATYLRRGIGLIIVDIVTDRKGNLHTELLSRLGQSAHISSELYTSSYHPVEIAGEPKLDIWEEPLSIGSPLPMMPLWLRGGLCLPVDLDSTYQRTCREQRIKLNGL